MLTSKDPGVGDSDDMCRCTGLAQKQLDQRYQPEEFKLLINGLKAHYFGIYRERILKNGPRKWSVERTRSVRKAHR